MTAADGELSYYLDDYLDEVLPCGTSLAAWAEWLSKPCREWRRTKAAEGGRQFKASVTRWGEDIVAQRGPNGWSFSRELTGKETTVAVRFAQGLGWDPDNIIWGEDMMAALRAWFEENAIICDDEEFIAVGFEEPPVVLTYRVSPPRLTVTATQH